jgi:hypothetical protein
MPKWFASGWGAPPIWFVAFALLLPHLRLRPAGRKQPQRELGSAQIYPLETSIATGLALSHVGSPTNLIRGG